MFLHRPIYTCIHVINAGTKAAFRSTVFIFFRSHLFNGLPAVKDQYTYCCVTGLLFVLFAVPRVPNRTRSRCEENREVHGTAYAAHGF